MDASALKKTAGFSIIEAMVALIVVSVGFTGVYALIGAAESFRSSAVERERTSLLVEQMFEVLVLSREDALALIADDPEYAGVVNLDSADCQYTNAQDSGRPGSVIDTATFFRQWCLRINAEMGPATAGDLRAIYVDRDIVLTSGTSVDLVSIVLQVDGDEFVRDLRVL